MIHNILRKLGTVLIVLSSISLVVLLLPLARAYVPYSLLHENNISEPSISIPKISAYAPLVFDVDPWNASDYRSALKRGVAHAKGSARPGERGMIFLFAHSSGMPLDLTQYNTVFFRLNELQVGDIIIINYNKRKHTYMVRRKEVVRSTEITKIFTDKSSDLILQTCTPPGTSYARLLVYAVSN